MDKKTHDVTRVICARTRGSNPVNPGTGNYLYYGRKQRKREEFFRPKSTFAIALLVYKTVVARRFGRKCTAICKAFKRNVAKISRF